MHNKWILVAGVLGLVLVYVFQMQLFYEPFQPGVYAPPSSIKNFNRPLYIIGKIIRYLLNDGFGLLIIWGLFGNKMYMRFAVLVFFFGLLILLPAYLLLVLAFYEQSHTFLNHLHRLVLNPVLMMLLIPAFYYQNKIGSQSEA